MKKLIIIGLILFFASSVFADNPTVQPVEISPLSDTISFSTVTLDAANWVTAPTVELRGRKEINILNTSTTDNIYLYASNITDNTVMINPTVTNVISRRLYPQDNVTYKVSSDIHIYLSSNTVIIAEITEIK